MSEFLTTEEWLTAFDEATRPRTTGDTGYRTVAELSEQMRVSEKLVRERIAALLKQGRVTVSREPRPAIDGRLLPVPVYRLKEGK